MNNNFEFKDWSVNRRARALDHMDQYIRKIVNVDGPDYFFWENHGIGNKSDEEVLKIAADDTAFINALFAFFKRVFMYSLFYCKNSYSRRNNINVITNFIKSTTTP